MKQTLLCSIAVLSLLVSACGEAPKSDSATKTEPLAAAADTTAPPSNVAALLQGKWQSVEDPKDVMYISDKDIVNIYDGKRLDPRAFAYIADCSGNACQGGAGKAGCFTSAGKMDIDCYSIVSISATDMQVSMAGSTGKTLNYKKVSTPPAANSARFDKAMKTYYSALASMPIDDDLLESVAHYLEPAIYDPAKSMVNCSDKAELARIKTDFMIGKLGCEPKGNNLETAISKVCDKMQGIKQKHRVVFYYLLVVQEDMASKFLN